MKKKIYFSGLNFELGQRERGLFASSLSARNYFDELEKSDVQIEDTGDVEHAKLHPRVKFFSSSELEQISWDPYIECFNKTLSLLSAEGTVLNWGGDHSVAISTVSAFVEKYPHGKVIWIDAHADLNVPNQSLSGNLHGMPLAVLLNLQNLASKNFNWIKRNLRPSDLIYLGLRDLDPFESQTILDLNIRAYSRKDIRKMGISRVLKEVVEAVGNCPVHISFDIDSVDPRFAPSTGVPVFDGFGPEDLNRMGLEFNKNLDIKSLDMVEINPRLGNLLQVDQTYMIAMQFIKQIFNPGGRNEGFGRRTYSKSGFELEYAI